VLTKKICPNDKLVINIKQPHANTSHPHHAGMALKITGLKTAPQDKMIKTTLHSSFTQYTGLNTSNITITNTTFLTYPPKMPPTITSTDLQQVKME
jgi:hypothetical protein